MDHLEQSFISAMWHLHWLRCWQGLNRCSELWFALAGCCELNLSLAWGVQSWWKPGKACLDHNRKHFKLNTRTCPNLVWSRWIQSASALPCGHKNGSVGGKNPVVAGFLVWMVGVFSRGRAELFQNITTCVQQQHLADKVTLWWSQCMYLCAEWEKWNFLLVLHCENFR